MYFPFSELVFGAAVLAIGAYYDLSKNQELKKTFPENPPDYFLPKTEEYDFIVGGGASGSLVATRLSENFRVILLEAGGPTYPVAEVPSHCVHALAYSLSPHHFYTWDSETNEEIIERSMRITQAKLLGGGSSVNGLTYNRGNPKDYDRWANYTNDDSWKFENILELYKKNEECLGGDEFCHENYGTNGEIGIESLNLALNERELEWVDLWHNAGIELGYSSNPDPNEPQKDGFTNIATNKRKGRRQGVYEVFLKPIENTRENLIISKFSEVKKVIFENNTAVGILYEKFGKTFYAKASKEIIISAGALNSPLILMRSGIGNKETLEAANIPLIADLPVGNTFQDHYSVRALNLNLDRDRFLKDSFGPEDIQDFLEKGIGPLARAYGVLAQAFLTSNYSKEIGEENWPDFRIEFIHDFDGYFDLKPLNLSLWPVLERPSSVGRVELNLEEPFNKPLKIYPNFLREEREFQILLEAIKVAIDVGESETFKSAGVLGVDRKKITECDVGYEWGSDEYWRCYIRNTIHSRNHPTSTCRMGTSAENSVVDSELRIHGVNNLRIIDNSVQPHIINSNVHSTAILIAEKGSQAILSRQGEN